MKLEVSIDLTVEQIAAAFAALDDDAQARFFVEVTKISQSWGTKFGAAAGEWQWLEVGKHLRDCACSTDEAREMIRSLEFGMRP